MIEIILEKQNRILLFFKVSDKKEIESKITSSQSFSKLYYSFILSPRKYVLEDLRINFDEIRKIYYD